MSKADLYCPHFQEFDETRLEQLFSKVAAVRAEDPELFDFTHRPISVYPSEEAGRDEPRTVSEAGILDQFSINRHGNHAVIIEGEVGTGKSELCAYLVHELRDEGRPILRVDKDDSLMSILTRRLPNFYEEHFDDSLPKSAHYEQLEEDIKNVPNVVASNATSGAILSFTRQGIDISVSDNDEAEIKSVVEQRLGKLVQRGEYGKQMDIISENRYNMNDSLHVFDDSPTKTEAVERWNNALWGEIQNRYDTPPLSEMLKRVGKRFEDTRPVAVFEDFGIASVEAKQLRNYIERDVPDDNWDFIIAGTRGVTEVLHKQTAEDRFDFFQTNKPDSNSVLFLDRNSAVDFIRPYLAYIKLHDGSVRYAEEDGEDTWDLLEPESGSLCAGCGLCQPAFRDLFPFNETFLRRIYTGLDESQQSPREFVTKVYDVLLEYYKGGVDAPSASNELGSDVTNPETPSDEVYDKLERFADLAKWYGTARGDYYEVPREFGVAFGYVDPDEVDVELRAGVEVTEFSIKVPTADGDGGGGGGGGGEVGGGEGKTRVERILDQHRGDVDDWIDDPGNDRFSTTNTYIRSALEHLINHVTDDYALWSDGSLRYNLSSQQPPFVYTNTLQERSPDQIEIDPHEFRRSELRELLEHGIRLEEDSDTVDEEEVLEKMGTQFTEYGRRWRQTIIDNQLQNDDVIYRQDYADQYDFDDLVVATYAWTVLLDNPWHPLTAERLNERFVADGPLQLDSYLDEQLKAELDVDDYRSVQELFEFTDEITSLVESRLSVTSNALDVREIRRRFEGVNPDVLLSRLAKVHINKINGRVRFSSSKNIVDLGYNICDCYDTIEQLTESENALGTAQFALSRLADVDMDVISTIAENLKAYDNVDPEFQESVVRFAAVDQTEVDEVLEAARFSVQELQNDTDRTQDRLHAELVNLKLRGHPVVRRLEQLESDWIAPGERGTGSRFQEVSEFYVE